MISLVIIYRGMINRCYDPKDRNFKNYGYRGIGVCDRWRLSFEAFCADMGERPEPQHLYSIERIDNNGNYSPDNCKWATKAEQALNKRSNLRLTFNGQTLTLSQWTKLLNFKASTLHNRLKLGWSIERALTTPLAYYQKPTDSLSPLQPFST